MFCPWLSRDSDNPQKGDYILRGVSQAFLRHLNRCEPYEDTRKFVARLDGVRITGSGALFPFPSNTYSDIDAYVIMDSVDPLGLTFSAAALMEFQRLYYCDFYETDVAAFAPMVKVRGVRNLFRFPGVVSVDLVVHGDLGEVPHFETTNPFVIKAVQTLWKPSFDTDYTVERPGVKSQCIANIYRKVIGDDVQRMALVFYKSFAAEQVPTLFLVLAANLAAYLADKVNEPLAKQRQDAESFPFPCQWKLVYTLNLMNYVFVKEFLDTSVHWEGISDAMIEQYFNEAFHGLPHVRGFLDVLTEKQAEKVALAIQSETGFFHHMDMQGLACLHYPPFIRARSVHFRYTVAFVRWLVYMALHGVAMDMPHACQFSYFTNVSLVTLNPARIDAIHQAGPSYTSGFLGCLYQFNYALYYWFIDLPTPMRHKCCVERKMHPDRTNPFCAFQGTSYNAMRLVAEAFCPEDLSLLESSF